MATVEEPRPCDSEERCRGQAVKEGRGAAAVQVAALVTEFGRYGEGPSCALGTGRGGDESGVVEGEGVEAGWGGGIGGWSGEFGVECLDARVGGEGEIGFLIGLDSGRHDSSFGGRWKGESEVGSRKADRYRISPFPSLGV